MNHHGRSGWAVALTMFPAIALAIALSVPACAQPIDSHAASSPGSDPVAEAQVAMAKSNGAKGVTAKAIDKVKQVTAKAADILSRVPCRAPKGVKPMGALPHVARKLAENKPVVIIAFGSSSTEGYGSTAPEFTYPNRLAAQLCGQPGLYVQAVGGLLRGGPVEQDLVAGACCSQISDQPGQMQRRWSGRSRAGTT